MDKIEGFKMFLTTTEENRYKIMHKEIPLTLDVFEKCLPFAIALDLEVPWTNKFKTQIEEARLSGNSGNLRWYQSSSFLSAASFSSGFSGFTSGMSSSISSSIASATTSSSSGSGGGGGGGSSGGGGGGGGGGGW
jgi:uncharacterized membrane protein